MSRVSCGVAAFTLLALGACDRKPEAPGTRPMATGDVQAAALASYVKPGDQDQYYLFYSGGHSGQVFVAGVPSMRHISTIPVFTPYPGTGYGFDEESKAMLGGYTWGDVHHPAATRPMASTTVAGSSSTTTPTTASPGSPAYLQDGADHRAHPQLDGQPGSSGFVTPNTEYALVGSRFSTALPKGTYVPVERVRHEVQGHALGHQDRSAGRHDVDRLAGRDPALRLGSGRRRPRSGYGWAFFTSYNSERATGKLEVTSTKNDRDYMRLSGLEGGRAGDRRREGCGTWGACRSSIPRRFRGSCIWLRFPRARTAATCRPTASGSGRGQALAHGHGLQLREDPEGDRGAGASAARRTASPCFASNAVREAEMPVGLGPLHTRSTTRASPTRRSSSSRPSPNGAVGPPWDRPVVDKIPVQYNIGHLIAADGDSPSTRRRVPRGHEQASPRVDT